MNDENEVREGDFEGKEVPVQSLALSVREREEVAFKIETAHRYPRSVKSFLQRAKEMATLTEGIAGECIYALPRKETNKATGRTENKVIEGPSARFAEIILSAWKNARCATRVVGESDHFVTAQAVFYDLESNVEIGFEVQRRISDRNGRKYSADMIGVTGNAACSIALRNAILKGIPKAFWSEIYSAARHVSVGDVKALANKRGDAVKAFAVYGVSEAQILDKLGRAGIQDVTIDDLVALNGFLNAIKENEATPESIFADEQATGSASLDALNKSIREKQPPAPAAEPKPATAQQPPAAGPNQAQSADRPAPATSDAPKAQTSATAPAKASEPAAAKPDAGQYPETYAGVRSAIEHADTHAKLEDARGRIGGAPPHFRGELSAIADDRAAKLP